MLDFWYGECVGDMLAISPRKDAEQKMRVSVLIVNWSDYREEFVD